MALLGSAARADTQREGYVVELQVARTRAAAADGGAMIGIGSTDGGAGEIGDGRGGGECLVVWLPPWLPWWEAMVVLGARRKTTTSTSWVAAFMIAIN